MEVYAFACFQTLELSIYAKNNNDAVFANEIIMHVDDVPCNRYSILIISKFQATSRLQIECHQNVKYISVSRHFLV